MLGVRAAIFDCSQIAFQTKNGTPASSIATSYRMAELGSYSKNAPSQVSKGQTMLFLSHPRIRGQLRKTGRVVVAK